MKRTGLTFCIGLGVLVAVFCGMLFLGSTSIPASEVLKALFGGEVSVPYVETIVWQTRLPMAIAAVCCGASLSVAGLMMQTLFHNPLAGPSVLGISSGASFGVAVLMLGFAGIGASGWMPVLTTVSALIGGMFTIAILYAFSNVMKSAVSLLIVGLMLSYLFSSGISLLNYFSQAEEIRSFLVWGLGSFMGLRLATSIWLAGFTVVAIIPSLWLMKPLNALLLGEWYAESVGYNVRKLRNGILLLTGLLVAVPTAFCGPIGFIGLIVPHLCRLTLGSSNHRVLLPASILLGSLLCAVCALLCIVPAPWFGILPINVITPLIGVPVILYLLVNRRKLVYF